MAAPRLSWKLKATKPAARNISQKAYRILVASDAARLDKDEGDLWDSGRVNSEQSILVPYAGSRLEEPPEAASGKSASGIRTISPAHGRQSHLGKWPCSMPRTGRAPSGLAMTGTLASPSTRRASISREGDDSTPTPLRCCGRKSSSTRQIRSARAYVSGVGYFELYINGEKVGENLLDPGQTNYEKHTLYVTHDITKHLRPGANALGFWLGNGFYGQNLAFDPAFGYGKPSVRAKFVIDYKDGSQRRVLHLHRLEDRSEPDHLRQHLLGRNLRRPP